MSPKPRPFLGVIAVVSFITACTTPGAPTPGPNAPSEPAVSPSQLSQPRTPANQKPEYPAMAKRLGQQGKVVVRVHIDVDGRPSQAVVRQSSGHPMLDQAAVESVSGWKFVPGRRNGVLEPMWFNVPITYSLN